MIHDNFCDMKEIHSQMFLLVAPIHGDNFHLLPNSSNLALKILLKHKQLHLGLLESLDFQRKPT